MGYTTSTVHGIEVPDSAEANNVPEDVQKVVTALEGGSLVKRLTSAQIAALTSPQKPAGLVVYNTTTARLQISDGTNFADIELAAAVYAIGVRTSSVQTISGSGTIATVSYTGETDPSSILASGVVTVPTAGLWMVTGTISFDGDGIGTLYVRQNSTDVTAVNNIYSGPGGGLYGSIQVATAVACAASDTLQLRAQNGSAIDLDIRSARFTVHRIGS
jgi:hypothetical protein